MVITNRALDGVQTQLQYRASCRLDGTTSFSSDPRPYVHPVRNMKSIVVLGYPAAVNCPTERARSVCQPSHVIQFAYSNGRTGLLEINVRFSGVLSMRLLDCYIFQLPTPFGTAKDIRHRPR